MNNRIQESKPGDGVVVFESESSYDFIEAAEALKQHNIIFEPEEEYTAEFRASRRAPPPYVWRILVAESDYEKATSVLSEKGLLQVPYQISDISESSGDNSNKFYYKFLLAVLVGSFLYWFYRIFTE